MGTEYEEAFIKIAGNVVANPNPGKALKFWRERFGIKQVDLARELSISPSVLSDYESGRRASPGVVFVRKYIEALLKLDRAQRQVLNRLIPIQNDSAIIAMSEFKQPVEAGELIKLLQGEVLRGHDRLSTPIYGYTVLDSIKAIYALSGFDFYRVFGATSERALIFTKVGMGRSPLVAIRVSQIKPRLVVLHGPKIVDRLALDLAERERIILALSHLPNEDGFIEILSKL
ncbi:MAG: helix-turn-helix domain-containing protein [Nitrososphaerota archaeon]|nr:helix-turn-helix domain-containing protein [Nitrososphaerales archaeon]MDW8045456.1 helix-turn-helix domain-containing protein [Nitrososphaerota archaeon]